MEKRFVLAIALSLLVLLSWSAWVSKTYHLENKEVTAIVPTENQAKPKPIKNLTEGKVAEESLVKFSNGKFDITFVEPSAAIKEIHFKEYKDSKFSLTNGFSFTDSSLVFRKLNESENSVTFVHEDAAKKILKTFDFSNLNYSIALEVRLQNISSSPLNLSLPLILGTQDFNSRDPESRYKDFVIATQDKTKHINPRKNLEIKELKFLGLRDRYFCVIAEPAQDNYSGAINKLNPLQTDLELVSKNVTLEAGQAQTFKFSIYLGPQDLRVINSLNPNWASIVNYGTFDFISQILLQLLEFFYRLIHNWGWAIVVLSLAVYLILYPLSIKQMRSMKEMQALQPKIEELRKAYKDNPQKLNTEIMKLYKEHKVNPFGGCLPLLLQMPIFFALYQALMRSVALRGASFLWIKDLSQPDRLHLPFTLPALGNTINILPIAMTIGMFFQQKISMVNMSSSGAEQQRIMLIVMPLLFGVIFYNMPSGLVLYWFINSALMLLFQFRMRQAK